MNTDEKSILKDIGELKANRATVYKKQFAKRKAFLEAPENAEKLTKVKAGMAVAKALYDARKASNISQKELAERLHTKQSYVAEVELGRRNITINTLERFAEACGKQLNIVLS